MTPKEATEGIEAHMIGQNMIKDAILKHGGKLTSEEFDNEFGAYRTNVLPDGTKIKERRVPPIYIMSPDPKAFILGGPIFGSIWIDLAQCMCAAGILDAVKDDSGMVVYSIIN